MFLLRLLLEVATVLKGVTFNVARLLCETTFPCMLSANLPCRSFSASTVRQNLFRSRGNGESFDRFFQDGQSLFRRWVNPWSDREPHGRVHFALLKFSLSLTMSVPVSQILFLPSFMNCGLLSCFSTNLAVFAHSWFNCNALYRCAAVYGCEETAPAA